MRLRWPRRRWGTKFTLTRPDGTLADTHIPPVRYWTRSGAEAAATIDLAPYLLDETLSQCVTIEPVECGPFDEAAYLADIDRENAEIRAGRPWQPHHDDDTLTTRRFCGLCAERGFLASFPSDLALTRHLTTRHGTR